MFWGESHTSSCWSKLHGVTLLPQSKAEFCCLPVLFSSHHLMICWYLFLFWDNLNPFRWKFMAVQDTGPNSCMVRHVETTLSRGKNHPMMPVSWYMGPGQEAKLHVTSRKGRRWREAGLRSHTYPTELGLHVENWCDKLNMRLYPSR